MKVIKKSEKSHQPDEIKLGVTIKQPNCKYDKIKEDYEAYEKITTRIPKCPVDYHKYHFEDSYISEVHNEDGDIIAKEQFATFICEHCGHTKFVKQQYDERSNPDEYYADIINCYREKLKYSCKLSKGK